MKTLVRLTLVLTLGLAMAAPAAADHPGSVTTREVQALQDDLANLEASLRNVPTSHARYNEFRDRAEEIRDNVTWLRVQQRRHRENNREGLGVSTDDLRWARNSIDRLHDDILAATQQWGYGGSAGVRAGTEFQVRLENDLSSRTARTEDRVEATVVRHVYGESGGRILIPAGTRVRGTVQRATPAQRPIRGGELDLAFEQLLLDDGTRVDIRSDVVRLDEELDKSETGQRAGIGAALGTLLGSVIGGRKGALVGLIVGGAGGAISSRGEEVELPAGTILTLRLDRDVNVTVPTLRR
jgi:hypothetical protein